MIQLYYEITLKLPDGVEIQYTDSGPLNTTDYTTLVVIHGTGFNGYGFTPLHQYAHKYNMRTVLLNRRGYRGSTDYTNEEIEDLKAGRKVFQDRLALQTAWFLEHFIKHEDTPEVTADRSAGGFILMGWSYGNATALAPFADAAVIPKALYDTVEPHLRSLVLFDPPFTVIGCAPPVLAAGAYHPFTDPALTTPEQVHESFKEFASAYYKSDVSTDDPPILSFQRLDKKPTYHRFTDAERDQYCDAASAVNLDMLGLTPPVLATYATQAHSALFGKALVFPEVNVLHITGQETSYPCIWAYMESLRAYNEALASGAHPRLTKFKLVPGGNHFLHYEMPDQFLREIAEGCAK